MKRLTPATLTLMMFGVIGLLVAAYIAKNLLAIEDQRAEVPSRNIPMAIAEIEPGTVITENHLGQGPYPVDRLDRDTLLVNRVVVGRVAKEKIPPAQPIRANQLYQPGELPPLDVAPGMRAVSVQVGDGVAMVDGMIKPNQFVDVLFTYQGGSDDNVQGGVTMRLFEGVRVIAINRSLTQSRVDRSSNRVTLELTEPQANVLVLAKDRGEITLTFNPNGRGHGGLSLSNAERVTLHEILGMRRAEPEAEPFMTEVFRKTERGVQLFNGQGRRVDADYLRQQNDRRRMVLPNQLRDPAAPDADPAPADKQTVPGPQDTPQPRQAPTASRESSIQK
jgi:pilus assembly protein CpaB